LDSTREMSLVQQFVKDSVQRKMDELQFRAMDWFLKADVNNLNKTIVKDFVKKAVMSDVVKKTLADGRSLFVPKARVGKAAVLMKNSKGIPSIPSLDAVSTANLINYEKALTKMPIYQGDTVWRTGAASKEALEELAEYMTKQQYFRNVGMIQGKPIGLDAPLDLDYQVQYILKSKRGRAGKLLSSADDKFDVLFKRGSNFKLQDIEWEKDKWLKLHLNELLDEDLKELVPVLDDVVDKKASKNAIKEIIGSTKPPYVPPSSKTMNNFLNKEIVITDATDIVKMKPFMKNNFTKKVVASDFDMADFEKLMKGAMDDPEAMLKNMLGDASFSSSGKIGSAFETPLGKFKKVDNSTAKKLVIDEAWEKSLSEAEKAALKDYLGNGYRPVNDYLRGNIDLDKLEIELLVEFGEIKEGSGLKHIGRLDDVLKNAKLKEDVVLYRGANLDVLDNMGVQLKPGLTFTDKGFVSTSIDSDVSKLFFGDSEAGKAVFFEIRAPKGARGAMVRNMSNMKMENEVLLGRNTSFKIKEVVVDGKITRVLLDVVEDVAENANVGITKSLSQGAAGKIAK